MARLQHGIKFAIVRALAAFDTPGQVTKLIKAEYGIDVTPQQVEAYDPTKRAGAGLSEELRELFLTEREKAKTRLDEVPIANKAVRLRKLGRAAERAEARGNDGMLLQILEQAAKEVGGAYEPKRQVEVTGKDGGPVKTETNSKFDMMAEVRAALGCHAEDELLLPN